MSPSTESNDDTDAAQVHPAPGHERVAVAPAAVVFHIAHARSAETDTRAKILVMLTGTDMRL